MNVLNTNNKASLKSERNGGKLTKTVIRKFNKLMLEFDKEIDKIEVYFKDKNDEYDSEKEKDDARDNFAEYMHNMYLDVITKHKIRNAEKS